METAINFSQVGFNTGLKYGAKARYSIRRIKFIDDVTSDDWYEVWFNVGYKKFVIENSETLDGYVVGFNQSFQDPTLHLVENNEEYNAGYLLGCGHGYTNGSYSSACNGRSPDFKDGYEDGNDMGLYMSEREGRMNINCHCKMFE